MWHGHAAAMSRVIQTDYRVDKYVNICMDAKSCELGQMYFHAYVFSHPISFITCEGLHGAQTNVARAPSLSPYQVMRTFLLRVAILVLPIL